MPEVWPGDAAAVGGTAGAEGSVDDVGTMGVVADGDATEQAASSTPRAAT